MAIGALLADAHDRGVDELHVGIVSLGNRAHTPRGFIGATRFDRLPFPIAHLVRPIALFPFASLNRQTPVSRKERTDTRQETRRLASFRAIAFTQTLKQAVLPGARSLFIDNLEVEMILEIPNATLSDGFDHLSKAGVEVDRCFVL